MCLTGIVFQILRSAGCNESRTDRKFTTFHEGQRQLNDSEIGAIPAADFLNSRLLGFLNSSTLMIALLQETQEIFIVNRLSDNRVQAIDSLIVGGVVERNTALA